MLVAAPLNCKFISIANLITPDLNYGSLTRKASHLFPEELVFLVDVPGGNHVYDGQHCSTQHRCSHPHRQQRVDDIDEEHGPPDAFWSAPGRHHEHPEHLYRQQDSDHQVTDHPHVVLVEAIAVAHNHKSHEECHCHRQCWRIGHMRGSVDTVEGQHDAAHDHQYAHEHGQGALVQPKEVTLVQALQFTRLEFFRLEHSDHPDPAVRSCHRPCCATGTLISHVPTSSITSSFFPFQLPVLKAQVDRFQPHPFTGCPAPFPIVVLLPSTTDAEVASTSHGSRHPSSMVVMEGCSRGGLHSIWVPQTAHVTWVAERWASLPFGLLAIALPPRSLTVVHSGN